MVLVVPNSQHKDKLKLSNLYFLASAAMRNSDYTVSGRTSSGISVC